MNGANLSSYLAPVLTALFSVGVGAFISGRSWNRQRQWEMRRDTVFEVMRILGELDNALLDLAHWYSLPIPDGVDLRADLISERDKVNERWNSIMARFERTMFLVEMVAGRSLGTASSECIKEMHSVAKKVRDGDTTSYTSSQTAIKEKVNAVYVSARKVLKLRDIS